VHEDGEEEESDFEAGQEPERENVRVIIAEIKRNMGQEV
jgi:hypothetical protein